VGERKSRGNESNIKGVVAHKKTKKEKVGEGPPWGLGFPKKKKELSLGVEKNTNIQREGEKRCLTKNPSYKKKKKKGGREKPHAWGNNF